MLKEIYFVNDSGVLISKYINFKGLSPKSPVLLSAFITALQGFSKEAFNSQFKGMELEEESIYVVHDVIYTIGIFSNDEPDTATFLLLNRLSKLFQNEYSDQLHSNTQVNADQVISQLLAGCTIKKFNPRNIALSFLVVLFYSFLMWQFPFFYPLPGSVISYLPIMGVAIVAGYLVPQRWWGVVLSSLTSFFPSGVILLKGQMFFFSDYIAAIYMFFFIMTSFIRDRRTISSSPVPKIPILSRYL